MNSTSVASADASGIVALSLDEIDAVGGGDQATYDYGRAIGSSIRSGIGWVRDRLSDAASTVAGWLE